MGAEGPHSISLSFERWAVGPHLLLGDSSKARTLFHRSLSGLPAAHTFFWVIPTTPAPKWRWFHRVRCSRGQVRKEAKRFYWRHKRNMRKKRRKKFDRWCFYDFTRNSLIILLKAEFSACAVPSGMLLSTFFAHMHVRARTHTRIHICTRTPTHPPTHPLTHTPTGTYPWHAGLINNSARPISLECLTQIERHSHRWIELKELRPRRRRTRLLHRVTLTRNKYR